MEVSPHPRWPNKTPETLQELQIHLRDHFDFSFKKKNIHEIREVLELMKIDSPQVLSWPGSDSFSTYFLSFHTGQPFMQKMFKRYVFPEKLKEFLETCTSLEKTTDQFAYLEDIKQLKDKGKIISYLENFLQQLPTQEEFTKWVEAIR